MSEMFRMKRNGINEGEAYLTGIIWNCWYTEVYIFSSLYSVLWRTAPITKSTLCLFSVIQFNLCSSLARNRQPVSIKTQPFSHLQIKKQLFTVVPSWLVIFRNCSSNKTVVYITYNLWGRIIHYGCLSKCHNYRANLDRHVVETAKEKDCNSLHPRVICPLLKRIRAYFDKDCRGHQHRVTCQCFLNFSSLTFFLFAYLSSPNLTLAWARKFSQWKWRFLHQLLMLRGFFYFCVFRSAPLIIENLHIRHRHSSYQSPYNEDVVAFKIHLYFYLNILSQSTDVQTEFKLTKNCNTVYWWYKYIYLLLRISSLQLTLLCSAGTIGASSGFLLVLFSSFVIAVLFHCSRLFRSLWSLRFARYQVVLLFFYADYKWQFNLSSIRLRLHNSRSGTLKES